MAKKMSFFKPTIKEFGGSLAVKGKRKTERVLDSRTPLHFVLKSKKSTNLYSHRVLLRKLLYLYGKRFGVKVCKESVQEYILLNDCEVNGIVPYAVRSPRRKPPS